jgi:hypothetical protein
VSIAGLGLSVPSLVPANSQSTVESRHCELFLSTNSILRAQSAYEFFYPGGIRTRRSTVSTFNNWTDEDCSLTYKGWDSRSCLQSKCTCQYNRHMPSVLGPTWLPLLFYANKKAQIMLLVTRVLIIFFHRIILHSVTCMLQAMWHMLTTVARQTTRERFSMWSDPSLHPTVEGTIVLFMVCSRGNNGLILQEVFSLWSFLWLYNQDD